MTAAHDEKAPLRRGFFVATHRLCAQIAVSPQVAI
jgi:hypothetical protein